MQLAVRLIQLLKMSGLGVAFLPLYCERTAVIFPSIVD